MNTGWRAAIMDRSADAIPDAFIALTSVSHGED